MTRIEYSLKNLPLVFHNPDRYVSIMRCY